MSPLTSLRQITRRVSAFAAASVRLIASQRWGQFVGAGLFVGVFLAAAPAQAGLVGDIVVSAAGWLCNLIISLLGQLILTVVPILIGIAQYNDFVNATAVANGWIIVRDVVNMFFIVILLIMAFGTMLGIDQYSVTGSASLSGLVVMAVVINFSRTICGLIIDFAQVIMLTFVNGFAETAGGNFVTALGLNEMLAMRKDATADNVNTSSANVVLTLLLAVVLTSIALYVVVMMTIGLAMRIITLWLLIILSPIAFFTRAVPGGQARRFYSDWWGKFTNAVMYGPFMAFFLWLSLVAVQSGPLLGSTKIVPTGETLGDAVGAMFQADTLMSFIISICLLMGGYMMAEEMSSKAGGGQMMGALKKVGRAYMSTAKRGARVTAAVANKIPILGTKDKETGRRTSIGGLASALTTKAFDTNLLRGFTKQGKEQAKLEDRAGGLRLTGQGQKALELDAKAETNRVADMKRRLKPEELKKMVDNPKSSKADRRAAMLAMAESGETPLGKFKGKQLGAMLDGDKDFKGDIVFEQRLRNKLKGAGDDTAMDGMYFRERQHVMGQKADDEISEIEKASSKKFGKKIQYTDEERAEYRKDSIRNQTADLVESGDLRVNQLSPEQLKEVAPQIAMLGEKKKWTMLSGYEDQIKKDDRLKDSYVDSLKSEIPNMKQNERTFAYGALGRNDVGGLQSGYGFGEGANAGKFNSTEQEEAFVSSLSFPGGPKRLLNAKPEDYVDKAGNPTAILLALKDKLKMQDLKKLAGMADGTNQNAALNALVKGLHIGGTPDQKIEIEKSVSFQSVRNEMGIKKPAPPPAPAGKPAKSAEYEESPILGSDGKPMQRGASAEGPSASGETPETKVDVKVNVAGGKSEASASAGGRPADTVINITDKSTNISGDKGSSNKGAATDNSEIERRLRELAAKESAAKRSGASPDELGKIRKQMENLTRDKDKK